MSDVDKVAVFVRRESQSPGSNGVAFWSLSLPGPDLPTPCLLRAAQETGASPGPFSLWCMAFWGGEPHDGESYIAHVGMESIGKDAASGASYLWSGVCSVRVCVWLHVRGCGWSLHMKNLWLHDDGSPRAVLVTMLSEEV
jgi:hypothetical protein